MADGLIIFNGAQTADNINNTFPFSGKGQVMLNDTFSHINNIENLNKACGNGSKCNCKTCKFKSEFY